MPLYCSFPDCRAAFDAVRSTVSNLPIKDGSDVNLASTNESELQTLITGMTHHVLIMPQSAVYRWEK